MLPHSRIARATRIALLPALLAGILAAGGRAASAASVPSSAVTNANSSVVTNANWIMGEVLPDGAIEVYPDNPPASIEPYLANYAAMGLARAGVLTGNQRYSAAAWNWLTWYADHEGSDGFVTDYAIEAGVETSTGSEDSTDAYAGTFLSAVAAAYPTDPARLASLAAGIRGAVEAILATQQSDGLTWALPSYQVKYLMDNGEAYDGLVAAARMERALGDNRDAAVATNAAAAMFNGIQTLWNRSAGSYNWAKFPNGAQQATDWAVIYPDAMEQATAVAFDVAGSHAKSLMGTFNVNQPSWANPAVVSYWPLAGIALESASSVGAGENGAAAINQYAVSTGSAWPFNVGTAGQLIFAESDSPLA